MATGAPEESAPLEDIAATLVANHREFLAFVERRVGNRATAEEILQDAFARSIDKRRPMAASLAHVIRQRTTAMAAKTPATNASDAPTV